MVKNERFVSMSGLVKSVLRQWRKLLLTAVVFAVLGVIFISIRLLPKMRDSSETASSTGAAAGVDSNIAEAYELGIMPEEELNFDMQEALDGIDQALIEKGEYIDNSFLSKMNPMAVPRKGAEHGVLKRTSSAPVKKAPAKPALWPASSIFVVAPHGSHTSNTPKKLMANAVRITTMKAMNPALWNCMPQPADPPPALTAATTAASAQKLHKMPAVVAPPKARSRPRLSPACLIKLKSLSESTGNTHGIKFRIIPPRNAKNNRAIIPAEAEALASFVALAAATSFSESFFFAPLFTWLDFVPAAISLSEMVLLAGARQMELSQAW